MASSNKNIAFDVVGTLVSYDKFFENLEAVCGDRLRAAGAAPKLFGHLLLEMAEREYTYLSLSGRYVRFFDLFPSLIFRALAFAGIQEPRRFATPAELESIVGAYNELGMQPGAAECIAKLRAAGFTVWGFTAGDRERVGGYFAKAGVELPAENLISCDSIGKSKPEPNAYRPVLEKLTSPGDGGVARPWFAAAHMWDVSTARTLG